MSPISYAQCWEDAATLRSALAVRSGDAVLSIASGGDNTLAMLLDNPRSMTAIDYNPSQIHLLALKACAMQVLDYDDFLSFVGARPFAHRLYLYGLIKSQLGPDARAFWDSQPESIRQGVIHCGKFERYMRTFRRFVLPLIVSEKTVRRLLDAESLKDQQELYRNIWSNWRWQSLFSIFFSRLVLGRYGRCQGAFSQVNSAAISRKLLRRVERGLTRIPARNNYLLHYMLTGRYDLPTAAPEYLLPQNFYLIRERLDRLHLRIGDLAGHLQHVPANTYSAYNLSDIFEYLSSAQVENVTRLLLASSQNDARAAFWTMFLPQQVPASLAENLSPLADSSAALQSSDRGFFYGSFNIWQFANQAPSSATMPVKQEVRS